MPTAPVPSRCARCDRRMPILAALLLPALIPLAACGSGSGPGAPSAAPSAPGVAAEQDPAPAGAVPASEAPSALPSGAATTLSPLPSASTSSVDPADYSYPGFDGVAFLTPSRNIACVIGPASFPDALGSDSARAVAPQASCELADSPELRAEDQDANGCPTGPLTKGIIRTGEAGPSYGACKTDINGITAWRNGGGAITDFDAFGSLGYGRSVSAHGYTCSSAELGVTCLDGAGRGFTISRDDYALH
ncbi:hypothetical protein [Actinomyces marmotae]|uniref:hypothetical protein n=1 Tax=Actinomyces marmotae TaxID=2737173 RepID=UPI001356F664|nr:hypothetical protein [Actinomyces marmotae]